MRISRSTVCVCLLALTLLACSAQADTVVFNFTAQIDQVFGEGLPGASVGSHVAGSYSFDPNVTGVLLASLYMMYYQPSGSWELTAGGVLYADSLSRIGIYDEYPPSTGDRYLVDADIPLPGDYADEFSIQLMNPVSADVIASSALPTVPPLLAQFGYAGLYYIHHMYNQLGDNGFSATLDTLTLGSGVPEPAGLFLTAGGLLGMAGWIRAWGRLRRRQ